MKFRLFILLYFVSVNLLYAETIVPGGTIDGDTWTFGNSPYIIQGDIAIEELTIEAGVEVLFADQYKFEINGILNARGFHSDSIYFKPGPLNDAGWEGIKFKNTARSSALIYCRIEGALNFGLSIDNVSPFISNCRIVNNIGNGIELKDTSVEIKHCVVNNNTGNGIELDASQITASNSIITRNVENGIHSRNNQDAISLLNVVVADNKNIGVSSEKALLSIKNSIIFSNGEQIFVKEQIPSVTYSAIQGATIYTGEGNINTLPEFNNRHAYTLSPKSLCVDAGDPSETYNDIYFPPSLGSVRNDMGAYGGHEANGWYPPLYIKPENILFGEVTQDSAKFISVDVLNYRNLPIGISHNIFIGTDSLAFNSYKQNFLIPVLDSSDVLLSFTPDQEATFQSEWVLHTLSHGRVLVPVRGEGIVAKMNLVLKELDFEKVKLDTSASMYFPIMNSGSDTLRLDFTLLRNSVFSLNQSSLTIPPYSSIDSIEISFEPNLPMSFEDSLIISSNDPLNSRSAIPLNGLGLGPSTSIDPESIDFGNVTAFSDSILNLIIQNTGNDQMIIDSINIIGQHPDSVGFEIINKLPGLPLVIAPDRNLIVPVSFTPIKLELATAQLSIKTNDPNNPNPTVTLTGTGIAGELELSEPELVFGEVSINSQSVLNLKLTNKGLDILIVDSVRMINQHQDSILFEVINNAPDFPLVLEPDSSQILQVGFTPRDTVISTAKLWIKSNNPFKSYDEIEVSGTGIAGSLRFSTKILDFGKVSLETTSPLDVVFSNVGDETLVIDTIKIVDQHQDSTFFNIIYTNIEFPANIEPDSNLNVQTSFTPLELGIKNARIFVKSRDPFRETDHIQLAGEGVSARIDLPEQQVDFGQIAVDSSSVKILYIYNIGWDPLVIPYDSISFSGPHADAYSLSNIFDDITVLRGDSAEFRITFQPAQIATTQADLQFSSNDPVEPVSIIGLTGIGYDGNPISVTSDHSLTTNPFINGQPATIGFIISGSQSIDSCYVHVRTAGKKSYNKLTLSNQSADKWSASIEATLVTERGVEYFVDVRHGPLTTYYPASGNTSPLSIQVSVPQMQFPWQTNAKIYQMISIPLATSNQTLHELFDDDLGPYDDTQYRIFDLPDGITYSEVANMDKSLPAGKAMWLITNEATQLSITNAQSVPTAQNFELQLHEGWNLIATPFAFPVDWNQVSNDLGLRYYDGTDWPFITLMEPFKGYAVSVPADTVLFIPPHQASAVLKPAKTTHNKNISGWRLQILAESENYSDKFNYIGAFEQASSSIDIFDYPEPLPIGDFVSLYLVPDHTSEKYSTDYRRPGMDQYDFDFEVITNISAQINITFKQENLPENFDWIVLSEESGLHYPKRVLQVSDKKNRFKVIVGTEQAIAAVKSNYVQLPLTYYLEQNYPNPFNPTTTIKFGLPEASIVTIKLYNILGQRINSLLENVQMDAGIHSIHWNGKNESGALVSSGIYFLQLKTDASIHYIKMILNR